MTAFRSRWLEWDGPQTPRGRTDKTDKRVCAESETPLKRTDKTDKSPQTPLLSVLSVPNPSVFQPETSETAAAWGDLAPIVEWFLSAEPPATPFKLKQGITITDPARWWADIIADIAAGPEGPRARYGALQDDVMRAWQMFGPQAEPGLEQ